MSSGNDAVGWLVELDNREALLVAAFRNAAVALGQGRADFWSHVEESLSGVSGRDAGHAALDPFYRLMYTIGLNARGEVRFHTPECPCLGHDEASFLRICRHVGSGMIDAARREAAELVDPSMADTLVTQVVEFETELDGATWPMHDRGDLGQRPLARQRLH